MERFQILLTKEIEKSVEDLSRIHNISKSEAIRKLLENSLGLGENAIAPSLDTPKYSLKSLNTYKIKNPRITGFQEIFSVGGKTPEIRIIDHDSFEYFKTNCKLPELLIKEIDLACNELESQSLTKKFVVRRAYLIPGLENPPGPRFIGLSKNQVIDSIIEIFKYAIDNKYDQHKGCQIVAFFHPFADPKPIDDITKVIDFPYGGYAAPLNNDATRIEIYGTWGNNEGVQSFDNIDRYIVDTEKYIILEKNIPQKTLMLCTTSRNQSEKLPVPTRKQFEQVLSDMEILETSRILKELFKKYGLRRVEYSYNGIDSLQFNESSPYVITYNEIHNLELNGTVMIIKTLDDINRLNEIADKTNLPIIYIHKDVVENRSYDILNNIATLPLKFVILYPGLSATAHAMRVLNDFGHTAVVVGNRVFENGDELDIKINNSEVTIKRVNKDARSDKWINLYDAKLFGREKVGGKAYNISILKSKGLNVPHGIVLTSDFLNDNADKKHDLTEIINNILKETDLNLDGKFAIRSSANLEDDLAHSFAGQFESYINCNYSDIPNKVLEVLKSVESSHIKDYLKIIKTNKQLKMSVIVQDMVDANKSGVSFGKDLQTGTNNIIIDAAFGLAEGIVDGISKTQRVIYSKDLAKIISVNTGEVQDVLTNDEIETIISMTRNIEHLMESTQDIEWVIDKNNNFWIVQSRPIN